MPQLVIYFYINQYFWIIVGLIVTIYLIGTYIIPLNTLNNVTRSYITKI